MEGILPQPSVRKENVITRHPVAAYYILTLALTWSIQLALIAVQQGWTQLQIPLAVHYLASFGPAVAALVITAVTTGREGLRELWGRITKWRVGWKWWLFCTLGPVLVFAASLPIVRLIKGEWPDLRLLGQSNYLPFLGFGVLLIWLATYGFGEEIGWRGFALPRLQKTMSVSRATLILGLMWALWHTPAFFYLDTFKELGLIVLPGFMIGVLFGAVVFTWIYNGTGGSILMVALWHGIFDWLTASKAGQDIIPIVMTAFVIVLGLVVTNVDKPWNFYRVEKHTL